MGQEDKLLTQPIPKLLRDIAIPASTGMFFNTMYNIVDTFYAGLISTEALAGLSLSFTFFFIIIGMGYGFSSAIIALIGNAMGARKRLLATIYAHKGVVFIPLLGVFLTIIGYIFAPKMFMFLGASGAYLQVTTDYMNIILYGTIFFMFNFALNAILVSRGDTKTYRNTLIFGFFANLILNPLFIYGFWIIPAMGVKGLALATVLIQFINMFYMLKKVMETDLIHFNKLAYFLPNMRIYKTILQQGYPASLNMLTMSIGSLILMYYVSTYGYEAVAGYGIGFRVEQIMLLPALGISTAALSIISNNFGAKKYDRVYLTMTTALKYGFMISLVGVIVLYIFGEFLVAQFDPNPEVIRYGVEYLLVEVWLFFAFVTLFVCVSTLQGIKQPKMIFYVGLYRQIVAKLLVAYIIVTYLQLDYIYLWMGVLVMIYSAAIFLYCYTKVTLRKIIA
ncbi:MATE family efflux transporter [Arcobacter sp. 31_11_sub10_T18]|nr:MATE family efflux transporter [Arcobacter sp. 31_11_sub10_T18]